MDSFSVQSITGIIMQKRIGGWGQYIKTLSFEKSDDNVSYSPVDTGNVFSTGFTNADNVHTKKVYMIFSQPVKARYIRMHLLSYHGHMSLRAAFMTPNGSDEFSFYTEDASLIGNTYTVKIVAKIDQTGGAAVPAVAAVQNDTYRMSREISHLCTGVSFTPFSTTQVNHVSNVDNIGSDAIPTPTKTYHHPTVAVSPPASPRQSCVLEWKAKIISGPGGARDLGLATDDPIKYTSSNRRFDWTAADKNDAGVYVIQVRSQVALSTGVNSGWKTIQLTIKKCDMPTITLSKATDSTTYLISSTSAAFTTLPTATWSQTDVCKPPLVAYTSAPAIPTGVTASLGYDTATPPVAIKLNFAIDHTSEAVVQAQDGITYVLTVAYTAGGRTQNYVITRLVQTCMYPVAEWNDSFSNLIEVDAGATLSVPLVRTMKAPRNALCPDEATLTYQGYASLHSTSTATHLKLVAADQCETLPDENCYQTYCNSYADLRKSQCASYSNACQSTSVAACETHWTSTGSTTELLQRLKGRPTDCIAQNRGAHLTYREYPITALRQSPANTPDYPITPQHFVVKVNMNCASRAWSSLFPMIDSVSIGGCGSAKCNNCHGDCDSDQDCMQGLICIQRLNEPIHGCGGQPIDNWDYCIKPITEKYPGILIRELVYAEIGIQLYEPIINSMVDDAKPASWSVCCGYAQISLQDLNQPPAAFVTAVNVGNDAKLQILSEKDRMSFVGKFKFKVRRFDAALLNIVEGPLEIHIPPNCDQDTTDPSVKYRDWRDITGFPVVLKVSYSKEMEIEKKRVSDLDGESWSLICGEATVLLINQPSFITISGNSMAIKPTTEAQVGVYEFTIRRQSDQGTLTKQTIKDLKVKVTVNSNCPPIKWLYNSAPLPVKIDTARDSPTLTKIGWFDTVEDVSDCPFPTLVLDKAPVWAKIQGDKSLLLNPEKLTDIGVWTFSLSSTGFAKLNKVNYQFEVTVRKDKACDKLVTVLCYHFPTTIYKLNSGVVPIDLPVCLLTPDVCEITVDKISLSFVPNPDSSDDQVGLSQRIDMVPDVKKKVIYFRLYGSAQLESSIFYEVLINIKGKSYQQMQGPFKMEIKIDAGPVLNFVPEILLKGDGKQDFLDVTNTQVINRKWNKSLPRVTNFSDVEYEIFFDDEATQLFYYDKKKHMIKMFPIAKTKQMQFVIKAKYSVCMKCSGVLKGVKKSKEFCFDVVNATSSIANYSYSQLADKQKRPRAYIQSVSVSGLVKIGFTANMNKKDLQELVKGRQIVTQENNRIQLSPVVEVKAIQGDTRSAEEIGFDWKFTKDLTARYLTIQIGFKEPESISQGKEKDELEIIINAPNLFKSTNGYPLYKTSGNTDDARMLQAKDLDSERIVLKIRLRPQISEQAKQVYAAMGTAAKGIQAVAVIQIVLSYFQEMVLGQLLAFVGHLSLYLHCLLFNLTESPTQNGLYSELFKIVQVDPILFIDEILDWMFEFPNKAFSPTFEELGYESQFVFFNLGSQFIFLAAQPVILVTSILLIYFLKSNEGGRVFRFASKVKANLVPQTLVQYTTINYTLLCVMAMINMYMEYSNPTKAFGQGFSVGLNNLFVLILLLWLTGMPIIIIVRAALFYVPKVLDYEVVAEQIVQPDCSAISLDKESEYEYEDESYYVEEDSPVWRGRALSIIPEEPKAISPIKEVSSSLHQKKSELLPYQAHFKEHKQKYDVNHHAHMVKMRKKNAELESKLIGYTLNGNTPYNYKQRSVQAEIRERTVLPYALSKRVQVLNLLIKPEQNIIQELPNPVDQAMIDQIGPKYDLDYHRKRLGLKIDIFKKQTEEQFEGGEDDIVRQNACNFRIVTESLDIKTKREKFLETALLMKKFRLETLGKKVTILFVFLKFARTYTLALDLIYMAFFPALQIHISQVISLTHLCLLIHYRPFDESQGSTNKMEIFAEAIVFALHYIMIEFTDFVVVEGGNRTQLNKILNGFTVTLTVLLIAVEFLPIIRVGLYQFVQKIKAKFKVCLERRRAEKARQRKLKPEQETEAQDPADEEDISERTKESHEQKKARNKRERQARKIEGSAYGSGQATVYKIDMIKSFHDHSKPMAPPTMKMPKQLLIEEEKENHSPPMRPKKRKKQFRSLTSMEQQLQDVDKALKEIEVHIDAL